MVRQRKTAYEFTAQKVNSESIQKILEAGRLSPSSHNSQPWSFIIVTDDALIDKLMKTCVYGNFHTNPPALIAIVLEPIYENQPGLLKESLAKFTESHRYLNIGFAASNIVNQATYLGIDSCILSPVVEQANKLLGISGKKEAILLVGLGFGKKSSFSHEKTRKNFEDIVYYNLYGCKVREQHG
ncbi:MAG: nitroreductase family protein [archaeon]|nr:nitroreductase family protein [archaeon]